MNIEEEKNRLKDNISRYKHNLRNSEAEWTRLCNKTQPSTKNLYNNMDSFFSSEMTRGQYTHILGGDGRSQPWDEKRVGSIVTININTDTYLSKDQKTIVIKYIQDLHQPDHITLNP